MADTVPLPPRPSLDFYRRAAKDLHDAGLAEGPFTAWARAFAQRLAAHGTASAEDTERCLRRLWHGWPGRAAQSVQLADAQFFLARAHGFPSWPRFAAHVAALQEPGSAVSAFEQAADAIVAGDLEGLRALLDADPGLVHARSERAHHAPLLTYVSANGVEDFRQRTPPNVVAIAELLLDRGADVHATSRSYGEADSVLMLTATSAHPAQAGVQDALLDLLVARGASLAGPEGAAAISACLWNGRGEAAAKLAELGAPLDLEGAAGVGRLDVARARFPDAPPDKVRAAMAWACEYGHGDVAAFLLDQGVDVQAKLPHSGQTALHWASYGGHGGIVRMLLARGADAQAREDKWHGTPLEWALYGWPGAKEPGRYYDVVAQLTRAGATLDPSWHVGDRERTRAVEMAHADARMRAALGRA